MSARRVTFVSHDASRTGAPMLLLDLVRWLGAHDLVDAHVLLLRGGPLVGAFEAMAPTRTLEPERSRLTTGALGRGLAELGWPAAARAVDRARLRSAAAWAGPAELVWLSAAPSLTTVDAWAGARQRPAVVTHVHELEGLLAEVFDPEDLRRRLRASDAIVTGARPVADAVVAAGADPGSVRVCDEFIPTPDPERWADAVAGVPRLRARLGIPAGAPVVGAIATASHRKGIDRFAVLARLLADRPSPAPEAHLVWVGGDADDVALAEARSDAARAGLADRVHFVGEQVDLEPWFALFDLLVLTSREDSFPLVCLHAGLRGRPVVAFDSGVGDLLRRAGDAPSAIEHHDLAALADRVAALLADPEQRTAVGVRLQAEVERRHTTDTAAPALWAVMREAAGWH